MGFEKVSHIDGGFAAISQSDFKIAVSYLLYSSSANSNLSCPQNILSLTNICWSTKNFFIMSFFRNRLLIHFLSFGFLIPSKKTNLGLFYIF